MPQLPQLLNVREEWLMMVDVAALLGINVAAAKRIARSSNLEVRTLPGCRPRYSRESVEALARQYTTPPQHAQ